MENDERITSVDVLRGFSLLGILLMNIVAFGLPFAAYMNPSIYGADSPAALTTWLWVQTLFEGKMRCLFSMLFGTSAVILLERAERRGAGIEAADIYYRRTMWLILIGMLHAYLIWSGDILYAYGVVGLLLFPLRKLSAKALIVTGTVIILVHSLQNVGAGFGIAEMREKAKTDPKVAEEYKQIQTIFEPAREEVEKQVAAHRGGWVSNLAVRAGEAVMFEFTMFFQFSVSRRAGNADHGHGAGQGGRVRRVAIERILCPVGGGRIRGRGAAELLGGVAMDGGRVPDAGVLYLYGVDGRSGAFQRGAGVCGIDYAGVPGGVAVADGAAGGGGADGAVELPADVHFDDVVL